ncbi:DUF742 domain-containing protein [Streptomyces antimicrobicus]|uniref:DUF742 domain-containing protein n=1 Tax=Streptomyces antimicrobicus TaxID=2883108 RepID=A0ABS8B4Q6_9ACTN|nr:DUF742 domain-containing protein [Streptomyces antimicrobicus]MCB5179594.1 DUF742 domain-containing protein [Streptomyces antimicrobicus]
MPEEELPELPEEELLEEELPDEERPDEEQPEGDGAPQDPRPAGRARSPRRTRLYALTDGRTAAPCTVLTMDTTITAAVDPEADSSLPTEWRAVLALCPAPDGRAVAELAARMHIRLTPMTLLLGELADRGLIHHRAPLVGAETSNVHLLRRIRDNLARI